MAIKQLDFDFNEDQRGLATLTEDWVTETRGDIRTVGTGYPGLQLVSRKAGPYRGHPQKCLVKLTYQGLTAEATYATPETTLWYVEPSFEDNPIETHPKILRIKEEGKGEVNAATGRIRFPLNLKKDVTTGGFVGSNTVGDGKANPFYGLTSWLTLGCLITKSYCAKTLPKSVLRDMGKITKEVPGDHGMETPIWGKWMKLAPRWKRKGTATDIEESWKLIRDGSGIEIIQQMLNS